MHSGKCSVKGGRPAPSSLLTDSTSMLSIIQIRTDRARYVAKHLASRKILILIKTLQIPLRGGHFVKEDIGAFDAPFFSITQGEAACMDPQHRRMLETAYHALEDAGVPISQCNGSDTSVYTGSFTNDYLSILQQDYQAEQRHGAMGIAPSMLANRLSWFFNFKGTSMNIDSACSSSLIALHLAAQDLRAGNSSMVLLPSSKDFLTVLTSTNEYNLGTCWWRKPGVPS